MTRIGGETNLVIGNDMNSAAGRVVRKIRQSERLVHDALTGESSVTVQKDRHRLLSNEKTKEEPDILKKVFLKDIFEIKKRL